MPELWASLSCLVKCSHASAVILPFAGRHRGGCGQHRVRPLRGQRRRVAPRAPLRLASDAVRRSRIGVLLEAGALKSSARDGLAVCFGLVYGGGSTAFYLFLKTATAKLFGRRHVGAIMGFINLALFCGIALGGVLYAVTRTSSGTYRPALRTSCAVSACRAAAVLWLRLSPYHVLTRASLQWPPRPLPRGRASARRRRRRPKTGRRRSRKSRCEEAPT